MSLFIKNYSTKSDEELMSLLTKGGQSAFDELYQRYSKPLLNFFFRMLNYDKERAEDLLQDLFLKIIEKPESFDNSKKFSTWFYTLAGNMIKNEYRNQQIRGEHLNQILNTSIDLFDINNENHDKIQFNNKLQSELNKLDVNAKTIFNLRFIEELSIGEIAHIMNCPEGTVKSRLFYLTKQLSKKLSVYKPELKE